MHVNSFKKVLGSRRVKVLLVVLILLCPVFYMTSFVTDRSEMLSKRMHIVMRAIGHDLLLRAGDFTSVIPPVIEKSPGVFTIEFRNEFAFLPDTLVAIVHRHLKESTLAHYVVTVKACNRPYIVYGFETKPFENTNIACLGRQYPKACYEMEIAFSEFPGASSPYWATGLIITSLLSVLALVLIRGNGSANNTMLKSAHHSALENGNGALLTIGKFQFDIHNQNLITGEESIPLTDKECKILKLLNDNIGALTSRDQLIQLVWTNEGVITGRSLDMFISKLRKKLSSDPDIRITNVHGKGYKLEVN